MITKKTLLFIGHSYHKKTGSSYFIQEILRNEYSIEFLFYDPYCDDITKTFKDFETKEYDVLLCWQIIPPNDLIKKHINYKRGVIFPMYDNSFSEPDSFWFQHKNFNIINFSKTLHKRLLKLGLSSYYIQYFPKPQKIENFGDEKSVFFWQRREALNINHVNSLLNCNNFQHVHIHKATDPEETFVEPNFQTSAEITYSDWFENKFDMVEEIEKNAIYIAPRLYEGIGMSFLEAMAMGRCVVAVDNPTMNEYIKNGETGYLFDVDNIKQIKLENVRKIQENALKYIENGYNKWCEESPKILDWILAKPKIEKVAFFKNAVVLLIKTMMQKTFSIKNEFTPTQKQKVITILGISFRGKRKNYK